MKKFNSQIREKLYSLSNLPETDYPFITLYMNVNAQSFLDQTEQNRIFLKNSIQNALKKLKKKNSKEQLAYFKSDVKKIKNFIENDLKTSTHGMAIFACEKLGIFETFQSAVSFNNEFVMDSFPHLKQLAFQDEELENALVVMLDSRFSKIYEVKQGDILNTLFESTADVHRFHKQGGWSQIKYQRGIEQEKDWHYKETSREVTKLADEEHFNNIILIGEDYELKNFKKHLPQRIINKIVGEDRLEMFQNITIVLDNARNNLYLKEKEREFLTIRDIIERAQSNDNATVGLEDIIQLAEEGRIDTLAIQKDEKNVGYKCGKCLFTSKDQYKLGCPQCNGNTKETDLIEEIIKLTLKNGGELEVLDPETAAADELKEHGGIGAYLRY